jgi:hypothetical protein
MPAARARSHKTAHKLSVKYETFHMSLRRRSCDRCFKARRKCDLGYPVCQRCQKQNKNCRYNYPPIDCPIGFHTPNTPPGSTQHRGEHGTYIQLILRDLGVISILFTSTPTAQLYTHQSYLQILYIQGYLSSARLD